MPNLVYPIDLDSRVGPFELYRGDAWSQPFRFWDGPGKTNPTDLVEKFGSTWTGQAKVSRLGAVSFDLVLDFTTTPGVLVVSVAGADTAVARSDAYLWDVQVTGGPVDPITVLRGSFAMSGELST